MAQKNLADLLFKYLPPSEWEGLLRDGEVLRSRVDKEKRFLEVSAHFPYLVPKNTLYAMEEQIREV